MADNFREPESGAGAGEGEGKPPRIQAEDNPWYLLATLYGVPEPGDFDLQKKNRVAWNRYFAGDLDEETRSKLIEEKRHAADELKPLSLEELQEVQRAFAKRCEAPAKNLTLPVSSADIDFSNVEFKQIAFFNRYLFRGSSFQDATFPERADFAGATFSGEASFERAAFSNGAHFQGATFSELADFAGATFSEFASFEGATFSGWALFQRSTFSEGADFARATFSAWAFFQGGTFSKEAYFEGAAFSRWANFAGATFSGWANFEGATFSEEASFEGATFGHSSSFVNAEMKGKTSFEGTKFKAAPPEFFGAKLHQGTVWRGISWPPTPNANDEAGSFLDAYACLKLEMDRLKKHEDELDFFALELRSRRVLLGPWGGLPIAIYGAVSDYGRSYLRPLVALFYLALTVTLAFLSSDSLSPWQSLGLSFANTLNVFGFRKDFFEPAVMACLPGWLEVVAAFQTVLGTILLFLFGLGIRNKFRMK